MQISISLLSKLSAIQAIVFDADGVLTDGKIIIDGDGNEIKAFSVKDGQLMPFMIKEGFIFGCISGRKSVALETRLKNIRVQYIRMGVEKKLPELEAFKEQYSLTNEQVVYIGDDINDINTLRAAGVSISPADSKIKDYFNPDYITIAKGGEGVLREAIELIIEAQQLKETLKNYIQTDL